jgi:hypothetical protein
VGLGLGLGDGVGVGVGVDAEQTKFDRTIFPGALLVADTSVQSPTVAIFV